MAARDRSDNQPLVELKYNSNKLPLRFNKKKYHHQHGKNSMSLGSSKQLLPAKETRHSYIGSSNHNSLAKPKKKSARHGLTTCLIFTNKESA